MVIVMKRLALYPFLFVLFLVLTPLSRNWDQLDPAQALRPLLILCLVTGLALSFFYLLFRDWQYAAYLAFLLILFFFGYAYLNRFTREQFLNFGLSTEPRLWLALWVILLLALAARPVWRRLGGRTRLVSYLNIVIALELLFPVYGLAAVQTHIHVQSRRLTRTITTNFGDVSLDCSTTPDIYYLVLDGYGRADMLADLYGFNNKAFLEYLESRGFYVASGSFTNYIQTIYSIPSSLNFNYIEPPGEDVQGQLYFSGLMRHNAVMAALKRCGYRTVAIQSGFYFTNNPQADVSLSPGIGLDEFESLLLADSPIDVLSDELHLGPLANSYGGHRQRISYAFEKLQALPRMSGPKFVFAHILSPHPPFVFDQSGQPLQPPYAYYIGDGDDYQGNLDEYRSAYPAQMQFVNSQLEQVIDSILENSSSPPVIILQGDHGPGSRLVWDAPSKTCLWERTPILNAYYLPGGGDDLLYPSISPVNSFRVVLNAYFDADLPLLPDKTYFTSHDLDLQAIDITQDRSSRANCSP